MAQQDRYVGDDGGMAGMRLPVMRCYDTYQIIGFMLVAFAIGVGVALLLNKQ